MRTAVAIVVMVLGLGACGGEGSAVEADALSDGGGWTDKSDGGSTTDAMPACQGTKIMSLTPFSDHNECTTNAASFEFCGECVIASAAFEPASSTGVCLIVAPCRKR